jgi:hypothetical protein
VTCVSGDRLKNVAKSPLATQSIETAKTVENRHLRTPFMSVWRFWLFGKYLVKEHAFLVLRSAKPPLCRIGNLHIFLRSNSSIC